MEATFKSDFSVLFRVFNKVPDLLLSPKGHLLSLHSNLLKYARSSRFMSSIREKRPPLTRCAGLVDGTVRPIKCPSRHQRQAFNGHERTLKLKVQAMSAPDGIMADLSGPWEGIRHYSGIFATSGLQPRLMDMSEVCYGANISVDSAYLHSALIHVSFKSAQLTV
jgi:hypothetical protein